MCNCAVSRWVQNSVHFTSGSEPMVKGDYCFNITEQHSSALHSCYTFFIISSIFRQTLAHVCVRLTLEISTALRCYSFPVWTPRQIRPCPNASQIRVITLITASFGGWGMFGVSRSVSSRQHVRGTRLSTRDLPDCTLLSFETWRLFFKLSSV